MTRKELEDAIYYELTHTYSPGGDDLIDEIMRLIDEYTFTRRLK